jgi:hypothetical protein
MSDLNRSRAGWKLRRRGVLAGLGVLSAGLRPAWAGDGLVARCIGALRDALAAMPLGPVLLNSYQVNAGADRTDFDLTQANAAYVYDNALAGLALLAAGDSGGARRIGQALAIAQAHDRFWHDGRLRNAYQAGAMSIPAKLPGWWDAKAEVWREDPYQVGSESGPVAWAMLLWAALGMRAPADLAGDWLDDALRAPAGYYGGFYGFEPHPLKLTWQSTEQNTDLFAAFSKLGRAEDAGHAAGFVRRMTGAGGIPLAGTTPQGAANPLCAADAGIWPYLAGLDGAASARAAIGKLRRGAGIGFSSASQGIWLEGTAFAALALRDMHDAAADAFLATVAANAAPSGYIYATVAPVLATGLVVGPSMTPGQAPLAFDYYRRPSLSATSWATLAALGVNPLRP